MARDDTFNVLYVAGMAALALLVALAGLTLTGERRAGLAGALEVGALVLGMVLFVAAGVGASRSPAAGWPFACAVTGLMVVALLAFLSFTSEGSSGSAVLFELGALVIGAALAWEIRRH